MKIKEYCEGIKFKQIQPSTPGAVMDSTRGGVDFDLDNTILPEYEFDSTLLLRDLLKMPRMSTFAVAAVINKIVFDLEDGAFVNVGVWNGFTFLSGCHGNNHRDCVGVDNFSEFGGPREAFLERMGNLSTPGYHSFYDMDYKAYFREKEVPAIGFYIYDGEHSRANQRDGLVLAEPFFTKSALIMVDDINFPGVIEGTNDFFKQAKGRYEEVFTCHTANNAHPTWWNGITLFRRVS